MAYQLFLPPYLQALGYGEYPEMHDLAARAVKEWPDHIEFASAWHPWRGFLDYMACVEHARAEIHKLPSGRAIGSGSVVPAQYHSASMVFFAQATFDNLAEWLKVEFKLANVKHGDIAFHKDRFRGAIEKKDPVLAELINENLPFIKSLERYRHQWIHRMSGGAMIFSDVPPGQSGEKISIQVPIDPTIDPSRGGDAYLSSIEECRQANGGLWLYSVDEFADRYANGCRDFILKVLHRCLTVLP